MLEAYTLSNPSINIMNEQMDTEDAIAIVGIGGMFPGAKDVDEFWRLLKNGENHVKEIPKHRWDNDAFYDPDPNASGKLYITRAGLMDGHDEWDNRLFGISDAESERIDLQQRYTLECVHMALEDGGITRKEMNGSNTGVYIGCMNDDYKMALYDDFKAGKTNERERDANYTVTGMHSSIISARVSYVYNLLGPSMTIDTACSSSLVAIHLGIQSIRSGEIEMAICGGVTSILYPETFIALCKARMMSARGQCHAFSDMADGYARGEGCGVVILQKLDTALKKNRKIWAIITTGCNQDGSTMHPITAPSGQQQVKLMRTVYERQNIDKSKIQYIEAHGTGTPVGDPIEANALGMFFTGDKNALRKIPMGSVKSNIGHLEASAGVAGVIKVLLMMKNGLIVRSLHIDSEKKNFNPKINFDQYDIRVPLENEIWESDEKGQRIACINSFGFGGTNSHSVIQQVQVSNSDIKKNMDVIEPHLICVSAADRVSLRGCLEHLKSFFANEESCNLADVSYTSTCRRDHFQYRVSLLAVTKEDIIIGCDTVLHTIEAKKPPSAPKTRFIFVFCGVGTTWNGMCREMMLSEPTFREAVREVDILLTPMTKWSIFETLETSAELNDPLKGHIAIFTCQIGLLHLWRSWGIEPNAVVGQSVGEVAAAYASGAICLADAVRIIYHRSRILASKIGGEMMVVSNLNVNIVEDICVEEEGNVNIAVYSSPNACTLSGDSDAIKRIKERIKGEHKSENVFIKMLDVNCAYHSQHVDSCQNEIKEILAGLRENSPTIEHYSTVLGKQIVDESLSTPTYWARNVRQPVQFSKAVEQSSRKECLNVFLEIGPKPVLHAHINSILPSVDKLCFSSMKENSERRTVLQSLGSLYENGVDLEWEKIIHNQGVVTDVPKYHFNRMKGFFEPESTQLRREGIITSGAHPFISQAAGKGNFKIHIDPISTPFVYDHKLQDTVLVPGATYAEVAFFIGTQVFKTTPDNIEVSMEFNNPVSPSHGRGQELSVSLKEENDENMQFFVRKKDTLVTSGTIGKRTIPRRAPVDIQSIRDRCTQECDVYESLENFGLTYGDTLTLNVRTWRNNTECLSEIIVPDILSEDLNRTILHPSVLDAMFQMIGVISTGNTDEKRLPKAVRNIVYNQFLQQKMYAYTKVNPEGQYNALLTSFDGHVIIEYKHFQTQKVSDGKSDDTDLAFWQSWQQLPFDMVIDAAKDGHKKTFLALTCNENVGNDIENLPVNGNLKVIHMSTGKVDKNVFADVLEMERSNDIGGVIFVPGCRLESSTEKSEVVLNTLKVSFKQLAELIKVMHDRQQLVPLFIITEGTQAIAPSLTEVSNIYGAELWGLTRSVKKEGMLSKKMGFLQNITLIDINPRISSGTIQLGCLISAVASGDLPLDFSEELAIQGGLIYYNTFSRCNAKISRLQTSVSELDSGHMALVKSSRPDIIYDPFLIVTEEDTNSMQAKSSKKSNDFMMVHLNEICLHDPILYSLTEEQDTDFTEVWTEKEKCEYQIVGLEAVGYETGSDRKDNFAQGRRLVVCYPLIAGTHVNVPRYATCPIESLRGYRPGLMTVATILWELAKELKKNVDILVIIEEESSHLRELVESLLTFCNQTVTILTPTGTNMSSKLRPTAIIYLTALKSTHEWVHRCFETGNVRQLLTLRQFLPIPLQRLIQRKYRDLEIVTLGTESIFSPYNLRDSLPNVFSWIKRSDQIITKHIHNTTSHMLGDRNFTITQQPLSFRKPGNSYREEVSSVFPIPTPTLSLKTGVLKIKSNCTGEILFRSNGCYIVVGGLTGLGWEIVTLLAEKGAGVVAIFSRRGPDSSHSKMISDAREKHDCKIISMQVDITDTTSLKSAIKSLEVQFPNVHIKGIFQGAAVLSDSLLIQMSDEQLHESLSPKVTGSWNLHLCTADLSLDYFVMHSSIVSVLGNRGQTNYAAGNAFMDSLAHYRRSKGLCGQSINWGPLAIGLAKENAGIEEKMRREGFNSLFVQQIRECLLHALSTNVPQITYNSFIWSQFTKNLIQGASKSWKTTFETVISPEFINQVSEASETTKHADLDLKTLREMSEKERKDLVLGIVHKTAGNVFMIDVETLQPQTLFMSLGVDSMAAMSFVNRISDITGYELPILKLLSDETTMSDLADDIISGFYSEVEARSASGGDTPHHKVDVTYIQEVILESYEQRPGDHTFLILVDFDVAPHIPTRRLRKLLILLYQRHPQMRTVFHRTAEGKYQPIVVSVENIGSDSLIGFDNDMEMSTVPDQRDPRMNYRIDISQELPVKFIRLCNNNQIILRLLAHKVVFDLNSFGIIKMDMAYLGEQLWKSTDIEGIQEMPKFLNIQSTLKRSLKPKLNELQKFWLKYMGGTLQPITLGDGTFKPINSMYDRYYTTTMPSRCRDSIFNFTQKNGITLFQFFASVYQLLLHLLTKCKSIPIITRVDLRMHIPQFRKIISRLINPFPLVAHINPDDSLDSYIASNALSVAETMDNNIYPYLMIKQAMSDSLVRNIERHGLNMAGMTDMDFYEIQDNAQEIKPLGISHISGTYETHFTIRYDRNSKTIDLECSYNEVVVEAKVGNMLSLFMIELIEYITMSPSLHIRDLPELGKTKRVLEPPLSKKLLKNQRLSIQQNELVKPHIFSPRSITSNNHAKYKTDKMSHFDSLNNTNALDENLLKNVHHDKHIMALKTVNKAIETETLNIPTGNLLNQGDMGSSTLTGSFLKQTSKGWDHPVVVWLEGKPSRFFLRWRNKSNRQERSLDSNDIQHITLQTINGTYALKFEAKHRSYIFKTPSHSLANRWMQTMKNLITAVS